VTQSRRYDDPCGIARALDVIGDRWALLVVRELIFGPKRFLQLRAGLRTVSPNVLSQRLRGLEAAGVVRREVLGPPAGVAVYELTGRGRALEPVLLELGRWGSREPITAAGELTPDAFMLALKTAFDPAVADAEARQARRPASYAVQIGADVFALTVSGGALDIVRGRPGHADVEFTGDMATMRAVAFGREPISKAQQDNKLCITGDRAAAERFTTMFRVPAAPGATKR
jgi:DNA-binding HxlR family transcriptional regulator